MEIKKLSQEEITTLKEIQDQKNIIAQKSDVINRINGDKNVKMNKDKNDLSM